MGRIIVDMSPSLDGYIAGKGVSTELPFGDAGHRLHHWLGFEDRIPADADRDAAQRMFETAGAVIVGRRMFDVGIDRWGDDGAFGKPCFVVTHRPAQRLVKGPTTFEFCESTSGALSRARQAAGNLDVIIAGGADIAQQCLAAGAVDELRLHVVPVLLGGGTSLFAKSRTPMELDATQVVPSPHATHITFKVVRP